MKTFYVRLGFCVGLAVPACATALSSQASPRYAIPRDTLRYESDNPFRMYWVRGADTIGSPARHHGVETHIWSGAPSRPRVTIRQLLLDVGRRTTTDTFTVRPDGRVELINGKAPGVESRIDLLLSLPTTPLEAGTRWSDTVASAGTGLAGDQWYRTIRAHQVVRAIDTLGSRVVEVASQGTVSMRFGYWADSAAGKTTWVDVTGPVSERYLFDVTRGVLVRRQWKMDLRGRGVAPSGPDTLPAGLVSENTFTLSSSPRTRFLLQPLPGTDTSFTIDPRSNALILLHTVARAPGRIRSALARNDGMVGIATASYVRGAPRGFEASWTDSTLGLVRHGVSIRGRTLVLTRTGRPDTTVAIPEGAWGIADYSMQELLVPAFLAIPRDRKPRSFSIFRPFPGRWDSYQALAASTGDVITIRLQRAGKDDAETVIITPDGDYLLGENSGPDGARRVPVNAQRQDRLIKAAETMKPTP